MTLPQTNDLEISTLRKAYLAGEITPETVFKKIAETASQYEEHNVWIYRLSEEERVLQEAEREAARHKPAT